MTGDGKLTYEEWKILVLLANGKTVESITGSQGIGIRIVRRHIGNIYSKLGVNNMPEAVAQAFRRGWLKPEDITPKLGGKYGVPYQMLTPPERDALTWASLGLTPVHIARTMNVARKTVYVYLHVAKDKLHTTSVEEAVKVAGDLGILNNEILVS